MDDNCNAIKYQLFSPWADCSQSNIIIPFQRQRHHFLFVFELYLSCLHVPLRVRSGYMRWENDTFLPISNFAVSSMGAWTKATPTSPQHHWSTQIGCPIPYECLFSSCGLQFYGNRKNWTQLWYWSVTPQCVRGWALNSLIVFSEPAVMKKTKIKKITKIHTGTRQFSN